MSLPAKDDVSPLMASPLLSGIDDGSRLAVFRHLVATTIDPGDPLLNQGRPNDRLWFVLDGTVAIERTKAGGPIELMATMSSPALFGTTTFFRSTVPTASIRATSRLTVWTLDRPAHEALRRNDPRAAEALALAVLRVLAERFDLLDDRIGELMAEHSEDHPRANEWANFRLRLFEDPAL